MWWLVAAVAATGELEGRIDRLRIAAACQVELADDGSTGVRWRYEPVEDGAIALSIQGGTLVVIGRGTVTDCTIEVSSAEVVGMAVAAGGSVRADRIAGSVVDLVALAGTSIEIGVLDADRVALDVIGGAVVEVGGRTRFLKAELSGGSALVASELQADAVRIRASVGSQATVHARYTLDATAQGASSVVVHGQPHRQSARADAGSTVSSP